MNLHDREESVALVKAALEVGKGRQILSKGDVPGHEFHGNQYSGASGKDDNTKAQPAFKTAADAKAYHLKAAEAHNNAQKTAGTTLHARAAESHSKAASWIAPGKTMGEQHNMYDVSASLAHTYGQQAWNSK